MRISVNGPDVRSARAVLPVEIEEELAAGGTHVGQTGAAAEPDVVPLPATYDEAVTDGDVARVLVLWIHGLAAMGWIVGVLALVVGLSTRLGVLAEAARTRLANAYRSWGAWGHWSLVPVVVVTGLWNTFYVSPVDVAWSPAGWRALDDVPYGQLYEAILIVKLALFGVLLVSGTATLARTVRLELPVVPVTNPQPSFPRIMGSVLGPAGIVYLATVPLILAAVTALRYVHVLVHSGA